MYRAIRFNTNEAPIWLGPILAASDWGVPPWEIAGGGTQLQWYMRWSAYRRVALRVQKDEQRMRESQQRRK